MARKGGSRGQTVGSSILQINVPVGKQVFTSTSNLNYLFIYGRIRGIPWDCRGIPKRKL